MKIKILLFISFMNGISFAKSSGITTSFPILTLITNELIESVSDIKIQTLTKSGEEAHHFEMSAKTLIQLQQQDLLIVNGLGFEHWLQQIQLNKVLNRKIIVASKGINPLSNPLNLPDPHAWHDPDNLLIYIENIKNGLVERYPIHKNKFEEKSRELKLKIKEWKINTQSEFLKQNKSFIVVTSHSAFSYLANAFGFKNIALLGDHEGESVSARVLITKITEIKKMKIRLFFGDSSDQDSSLKDWSNKTSSIWGGILWGDTIAESSRPFTLLEYLKHNTDLILNKLNLN